MTQIGRENNISAEFWLCRVAEDVDPYNSKFIYKNIDATVFWTDFIPQQVADYIYAYGVIERRGARQTCEQIRTATP